MGKLSVLVLCASWCGPPACGDARTVAVDRALLVPLRDPPAAAVEPSRFVAGYASVTGLPTAASVGTPGGDGATGDEVPAVQLSAGGLFRFDSGMLVGGEIHGAVATTAVRSAGQLPMTSGATVGARVVGGYSWRARNGLGLTASIEGGFDALALNDTLNGSSLVPMLALGTSVTPTLNVGRTRVFAGPTAALVPRMSRHIAVTCIDNDCGDTAPGFFDFDVAIGGVAGARYQISDAYAVSLTASVNREAEGWVPAVSITFSCELARDPPPEDERPPELAPPFHAEAAEQARRPYLHARPHAPMPGEHSATVASVGLAMQWGLWSLVVKVPPTVGYEITAEREATQLLVRLRGVTLGAVDREVLPPLPGGLVTRVLARQVADDVLLVIELERPAGFDVAREGDQLTVVLRPD